MLKIRFENKFDEFKFLIEILNLIIPDSGFHNSATRINIIYVCYHSIISAITPVNMDATDDIAQTLTCNIGEVTQAVSISWKTPSGGDVTDGVGGYTVTQGSVVSNVQKSTLTITSDTLKTVLTAGSTPLTWKCAAKSTEYSDSTQSAFKDVVVTFLTFGESCFGLLYIS